jgi:tRNA dimethylallyltransferase
MNYLIVIVGATAVGKTDLAIQLAQTLQTEIISADSRQVYKEMTIGTAKPTEEELTLVKHYFINSHHITEEYNAGQFEKDVLTLLETLFQKYKTVVMVGGSGLYIKAVCEGFDPMPEIADPIRETLQKELEQKGLETLVEELKQKDADYYEQVDKANPQRILRALEVIRSTGKTYSFFRKKEQNQSSLSRNLAFEIIKIGIDRPREELYERIDARMAKMLTQGLFEEAKRLYPYRQINALQTVGYQEVFDFLEDKYVYEEMVRLLKRNSRRYAKRQLTWFRKDTTIHWFLANEVEKILSFLQQKIANPMF